MCPLKRTTKGCQQGWLHRAVQTRPKSWGELATDVLTSQVHEKKHSLVGHAAPSSNAPGTMRRTIAAQLVGQRNSKREVTVDIVSKAAGKETLKLQLLEKDINLDGRTR